MNTFMSVENDELSYILFKLIAFYQQLLYVCNSFLTFSESKVLPCFGFIECKQIQIKINPLFKDPVYTAQ
jgi:hypothetical protein